MAIDTFGPLLQVLLGVYLGLIAGIVPALVAFGFGFVFRYVTGLTAPGFAVVVLAIAVAGINGGFLAFLSPEILNSQNSLALVTALSIVLMLSFYTHAQGDRLGGSLPKRISLKQLSDRTLSADVVDLVGNRGRATVEVVGDVSDVEGYPPLPDALRRQIRETEWTFPADLPLSEIERRFEDRLRSEFDVADAQVTVDERARATVQAAPPMSGVSKRVPAGERAVSVEALVPTGVARGDEVVVVTPDRAVSGTVVAARSGEAPGEGEGEAKPADQERSGGDGPPTATDGGTSEEGPAPPRAPTTTGGRGRVTVAVDRADAEALLDAPEGRVLVTSRGTRREFELVSLLRRAGQRMRRLTVGASGPLDGQTLAEADVRGAYGVAVLAVRHDDRWVVAPRGDARLAAGDDLFAVGTRDALAAFQEVVAA